MYGKRILKKIYFAFLKKKKYIYIYIYRIILVSVDLGVMAIKKYSTLPRSPELDPHYQISFCVILLQGIQSVHSKPC